MEENIIEKRYNRSCLGLIWFSIFLSFVGFFIIIAYILVNRRKKTFTAVLKNPTVPISYHNV